MVGRKGNWHYLWPMTSFFFAICGSIERAQRIVKQSVSSVGAM